MHSDYLPMLKGHGLKTKAFSQPGVTFAVSDLGSNRLNARDRRFDHGNRG
jgi:hypothetical protein